MKKEIYQILENIVKSSGPETKLVNIKTSETNPNAKIIEATDSKRAIRITLENDSSIKEGQFDIAKNGKDYIFIQRSSVVKFPDTSRVIPKEEAIKFSKTIETCEQSSLPGQVTGWFGFFQRERNPKLSRMNTVLSIYLELLKPWAAIATEIVVSFTASDYPILLVSEVNDSILGDVKIEYVAMPYGEPEEKGASNENL